MNSIYDIVNNYERICAVFTKKNPTFLKFRPDGTGFTGNWRIGAQRKFEHIVIYRRTDNTNTIYKACVCSY